MIWHNDGSLIDEFTVDNYATNITSNGESLVLAADNNTAMAYDMPIITITKNLDPITGLFDLTIDMTGDLTRPMSELFESMGLNIYLKQEDPLRQTSINFSGSSFMGNSVSIEEYDSQTEETKYIYSDDTWNGILNGILKISRDLSNNWSFYLNGDLLANAANTGDFNISKFELTFAAIPDAVDMTVTPLLVNDILLETGGVDIPVTGITLDVNTLIIYPESPTGQLLATITPANATNQVVTWTSSDINIAEVDNTGFIIAKNPGTTIITATSDYDLNIFATCQVTIYQPVTGISLDQKTMIIKPEEHKLIFAVITPDNATEQRVLWSSSDNNIVFATHVAGYSKNGSIVGIKPGNAIVTAKSDDNYNIYDTCQVTVIEPVTGILLDLHDLILRPGEIVQLKATVLPENASIKTYTWKSSDINIADVDSNGLVTAKKPGIVGIAAVSDQDDWIPKSDTCQIVILAPEYGTSCCQGLISAASNTVINLRRV